MQPPPTDYFSQPRQQDLLARFDRPVSAMAYRSPRPLEYGYSRETEGQLSRQSSLSRKHRAEEERRSMPPPMRPSTTRPSQLYRTPTTPARRSGVFEAEDFGGDAGLFRDISPQVPYDYQPSTSRTRRLSLGATRGSIYDRDAFRTEVAATGGSRRNSYVGGVSVSSGSGYEEKIRQASAYQDDVGGGPTMPLTADALRKANKKGSSSRSTRSSASRDESDYRHSASTRTTNDGDYTIRVKGGTVLKVGDAELKCREGAEIDFVHRKSGYRSGSDKSSSYAGIEDRRGRKDKSGTRTRASSQSGSYTRTLPHYAAIQYPSYGVGDDNFF
jgi:hypothetical protein